MSPDHSLSVEASRPDAVGMKITGRVIANFACQHLKAATFFRDQVCTLEEQFRGQPLATFFEDIRSFSSACIMSATASLEG